MPNLKLSTKNNNLMKTLKVLFALAIAVMMASCDSNKGKVSDIAKQFVEAVQNKDKVSIYDLYPNARTYSSLQLTDSIASDGVDVEFNKEDSVYLAKLNDKQTLVFKVETDSTSKEEKLVICDSYNILLLDSICYDLAAKTGAPVKKNSDMTNGELFSNDSEFIQYLSEQYSTAANGNLYFHDGRYSWQGGWYPSVTISQPITNGGEMAINGEDYSIEFEFYTKDTGDRIGTSVLQGWDLAPNETTVLEIIKKELYYYAHNRNVTWTETINFKNASTATMLDRYGSFTGKEYEEFLKAQAENKDKKKEGSEGEQTEEQAEEPAEESEE